jgi:hypothetical protein
VAPRGTLTAASPNSETFSGTISDAAVTGFNTGGGGRLRFVEATADADADTAASNVGLPASQPRHPVVDTTPTSEPTVTRPVTSDLIQSS